MKFSIVQDTASEDIYKLVSELREYLEEKIILLYEKENLTIGIAIRCLPDSYNRRSFTRYVSNENYLTVDFCISLEKYQDMHVVEQKYYLGEEFLTWLTKGLSNKNLIKNNPKLNVKRFIEEVKEIGREIGWFEDEIDWANYLDQFNYNSDGLKLGMVHL